MAQSLPQNPQPPPHTQLRPFSADFTQTKMQSSMLFNILPSVVQSRLPQLPSIRRSASAYGSTRWKSPSGAPSSGSQTPEMGCTSTMVLRDLPDGVSSDGEEMEGYFVEQASSVEDLSIENTPSQTPRSRQTIDASESKSGIGWKFANQGTSSPCLSL